MWPALAPLPCAGARTVEALQKGLAFYLCRLVGGEPPARAASYLAALEKDRLGDFGEREHAAYGSMRQIVEALDYIEGPVNPWWADPARLPDLGERHGVRVKRVVPRDLAGISAAIEGQGAVLWFGIAQGRIAAYAIRKGKQFVGVGNTKLEAARALAGELGVEL